MSQVDVVVVGAGVAGLSAATRLRAEGRSCVVLEAGQRVGGRALTTQVAGTPFDQGASWLHGGEDNPLTPIARAAGLDLQDWSKERCERIRIGERWADAGESAESEEAEERITSFLSRRAERERDMSLADAAAPLAGDPWMTSMLAWEGSIIAAADPDVLSLHDWHANLLNGHNLSLTEGIGDFVARHLAPGAETIRLGHAVRRIRRGRAPVVEGDWGSLQADRVIVTVSTGVLASGDVVFDPPLPDVTQAAIDALPMGLLSKVALPASGADRLDMPNSCSVWRRMAPGDPALVLMSWPLGRRYVLGHFGGRTAWAHTNPAAAEDMVRSEWRRIFGERADRALDGGATVTDWGTNRLFRGAYAYAVPGRAAAREDLARPLDGGHLRFAGEACHPTLAGTVGGAWLSGQKSAEGLPLDPPKGSRP